MIAFKVSNVAKKYNIGFQKDGSLREALTGLLSSKLNKSHEEFWALNDVSFEIKKGEVIGIIGKNGAGKSTLLKILSQITRPTTGRIEINGRVASLLEVGTGFHPELTGRENIYLNGTILGMTRQEVKDKFDEIVEFSGVRKFIDTPVKHYSSGMYVRLAFAVAAHLEPEILIIDEVLAVGDAEFQKKCLGKMKEVAEKGRTVIFVSHDLGMVEKLCDTVMWLENGTVKECGDALTIIGRYTSHFDKDIVQDRVSQQPVYFKNVSLQNSKDEVKSIFLFEETITVSGEILIQVAQSREMQICIALLDRTQKRVFSQIVNFQADKVGPKYFSFELPNSLIAANFYSFLFQIYPPPGIQIFDELFGVLPFEIIDNSTNLIGYKNYGHIVIDNQIVVQSNQFIN